MDENDPLRYVPKEVHEQVLTGIMSMMLSYGLNTGQVDEAHFVTTHLPANEEEGEIWSRFISHLAIDLCLWLRAAGIDPAEMFAKADEVARIKMAEWAEFAALVDGMEGGEA